MLSDKPWQVYWHCHTPNPNFSTSTESGGVSPVGFFALKRYFLLPFFLISMRQSYTALGPTPLRSWQAQKICLGKILGVKNVLKD